eukprot:scaffold3685_cov242-Pinguiococcus_pyrenoidosus.AAC.8
MELVPPLAHLSNDPDSPIKSRQDIASSKTPNQAKSELIFSAKKAALPSGRRPPRPRAAPDAGCTRHDWRTADDSAGLGVALASREPKRPESRQS